MTASTPAGLPCPNCGRHLDAEPPPFCPGCGQEVRVRPPTVGEFLQQFGGAYLSTEGALGRTLKLLFTQPGELTRQYLAGRRKHFVLPLRLYLTMSVLALLVVRLVADVTPMTGADNPALASALRSAQPTAVLNFHGSQAGLRNGVLVCERMPHWVCLRIGEQIRADPPAFLAKLQQANQRVVANWGVVMFLLLPLFTLGLRVLHAGSGMVYAEHLVFTLHLHACWSVILLALLVEWLPLTVLALAVIVIYTLMAAKRVYGGRWWVRGLRALLLSAYYVALLRVAGPLSLLASLLL
jgi:hypothetical protein